MTDLTNKVYVDIESLFDLRAPVIRDLLQDDEKYTNLIASEEYNLREVDEFEGITKEDFDRAYNTLTLDHLKSTSITYLVNIIRTRLNNSEKTNLLRSTSGRAELVLNVFPIKMSQEVMNEIQNALFIKLDVECKITIIDFNPTYLTQEWFNSHNYSAVYIYRFDRWMNFLGEAAKETRLEATLMFPHITDKVLTEDEVETLESFGFSDQFSLLRFLIASKYNITFIPATYYSASPIAGLYIQHIENIYRERDITIEEVFNPNGDSSE